MFELDNCSGGNNNVVNNILTRGDLLVNYPFGPVTLPLAERKLAVVPVLSAFQIPLAMWPNSAIFDLGIRKKLKMEPLD